MSLRRRITLATTLAVALVALLVGASAYLSTDSSLVKSIRSELQQRAAAYRQFRRLTSGKRPTPRGFGDRPGSNGLSRSGTGKSTRNKHRGGELRVPNAPAFGGARGYFQAVTPKGKIVVAGDEGTALPIDAEVLAIARSGRGSFFRDVNVNGIHLEVYTFADRPDSTAVEVALPLTSADSLLHSLLIRYLLVVGGGILLAGLLGAYVARTALRPIRRFSDRTEAVTGVLDEQYTGALLTPPRLEQNGAAELDRLAFSFNQTLDALERSIQAQRHLIADASHELRTPMAALRSNVQIFLEADRLPAADRAELQDAIVAELDELTQLVADVLDLARGAAPGEHVEQLELDTVVREAIARAQRRAPTLTFVSDLEPTIITNAPDRVFRAVTNVIDNARKWSPPDSRIEVRLKDGRLTVRDHGPGFTASDLGHVFDRFYRADEARRLPGSGLGLAIVQQAAQAYGGHARAGNADDGGAVLTVEFGSRAG